MLNGRTTEHRPPIAPDAKIHCSVICSRGRQLGIAQPFAVRVAAMSKHKLTCGATFGLFELVLLAAQEVLLRQSIQAGKE